MKKLVKALCAFSLVALSLPSMADIIISDNAGYFDENGELVMMPEGEKRVEVLVNNLVGRKKVPLVDIPDENNMLDTTGKGVFAPYIIDDFVWVYLKDANEQQASCYLGTWSTSDELMDFETAKSLMINARVGSRFQFVISNLGECKSIAYMSTTIGK